MQALAVEASDIVNDTSEAKKPTRAKIAPNRATNNPTHIMVSVDDTILYLDDEEPQKEQPETSTRINAKNENKISATHANKISQNLNKEFLVQTVIQ
jgi:hypothetical protein